MEADMTNSQYGMILRLLDERVVSAKCASRIIELLLDQPISNDDGLSTPNMKPSK